MLNNEGETKIHIPFLVTRAMMLEDIVFKTLNRFFRKKKKVQLDIMASPITKDARNVEYLSDKEGNKILYSFFFYHAHSILKSYEGHNFRVLGSIYHVFGIILSSPGAQRLTLGISSSC